MEFLNPKDMQFGLYFGEHAQCAAAWLMLTQATKAHAEAARLHLAGATAELSGCAPGSDEFADRATEAMAATIDALREDSVIELLSAVVHTYAVGEVMTFADPQDAADLMGGEPGSCRVRGAFWDRHGESLRGIDGLDIVSLDGGESKTGGIFRTGAAANRAAAIMRDMLSREYSGIYAEAVGLVDSAPCRAFARLFISAELGRIRANMAAAVIQDAGIGGGLLDGTNRAGDGAPIALARVAVSGELDAARCEGDSPADQVNSLLDSLRPADPDANGR